MGAVQERWIQYLSLPPLFLPSKSTQPGRPVTGNHLERRTVRASLMLKAP